MNYSFSELKEIYYSNGYKIDDFGNIKYNTDTENYYRKKYYKLKDDDRKGIMDKDAIKLANKKRNQIFVSANNKKERTRTAGALLDDNVKTKSTLKKVAVGALAGLTLLGGGTILHKFRPVDTATPAVEPPRQERVMDEDTENAIKYVSPGVPIEVQKKLFGGRTDPDTLKEMDEKFDEARKRLSPDKYEKLAETIEAGYDVDANNMVQDLENKNKNKKSLQKVQDKATNAVYKITHR